MDSVAKKSPEILKPIWVTVNLIPTKKCCG